MAEFGSLAFLGLVAIAAVAATRWRFIQLPISVWSVVALGIAVALSQWIGPSSGVSSWLYGGGCVLAFGLALYGLWLHFQPNVARRQKYEWFVTSVGALWIALSQRPPNLVEFTDIALVIAIVIASQPLLQILVTSFVRPWEAVPGSRPSKRTLTAHRLVRGMLLPLLLVSFLLTLPPLVSLYLILRYAIGERLERTPILYLRSFDYGDAPSALGRIVVKVAFRFGVLFAIVHKRQKGSDLLAESPASHQPVLITVEDEQWQRHVLSMMRICSAVIIDRSVSSEGLVWETEQAKAFLDPSRIVVLQKRSCGLEPMHGIRTLEYDLDRTGQKEARRALRRWFQDSAFATSA